MQVTKNRSQLVHEAADKLNLVGTGQPLEAEYAAKIDTNIDPLFSQLSGDKICHVADDDAIPSEWFDALAILLANINAPLSGQRMDPGIKDYAENLLKRITASQPSYETQENEYF